MFDCCCFLAFDFCRFWEVIRFFQSAPQRPMTSGFERFSIPDFNPLHKFSYLNSWEKSQYFPFECSVLNKGTTGTIFITSLVWCCPWLGIEPGPPALEASILPLGYREGGWLTVGLRIVYLANPFFYFFPQLLIFMKTTLA